MQRIYTIGHSNQSLEEFMSLLHKHEVNIIVDVRSIPLCRYVLQFNQKPLSKYLQGKGVKYLYLGNELGGRRSDCINENGQVDFGQAMHSDSFLKGVKQVNDLLYDGLQIALMCSEANPLRCHRFSLVARYFHEHGVDVQHILSDGKVKSHVELEREMIGQYLRSRKYHLSEVDLLLGTYTAEEQRRDAYLLKNREIGYRPSLKTTTIYD